MIFKKQKNKNLIWNILQKDIDLFTMQTFTCEAPF